MPFTEIIKGLRKQRNITQVQLAEAIGVSAGNVGDWESGKSRPGYGALISLSHFFHVSADVLLGLSEEGLPHEQKSDWEKKLLTMVQDMDEDDRDDIYGLALMKYSRNQKR